MQCWATTPVPHDLNLLKCAVFCRSNAASSLSRPLHYIYVVDCLSEVPLYLLRFGSFYRSNYCVIACLCKIETTCCTEYSFNAKNKEFSLFFAT